MDHDNRDAEIDANGSICDIYGDYRRLKDLSREARYAIAEYTPRHWEEAQRRLHSIKSHLGY